MTTYGAIVLEHFRRPRNHRRLDAPSVAREAYNPLCGDRVRVELAIDDEAITSAAFTANACAICTASASLLTERLTGVAVSGAMAISDDEVVAALESDVPDGRRACATLPLNAMRQGLAEFRDRG
jgi:nitrogen fixation protein NifU and related proteins